MGLGDFVPDVIEDKIEDGVELIGEGIEELGNVGADLLEDVGWEGGADWVRDKSRSAANALGADVDELQLGQTEDPKKLIYGSAEKLRSTASHLKDFAKAFDNVGKGIKGLDSGRLKGEAADAFRTKAAKEPPKWFKAADACEKAAGALEDFAGTVEWAQGRAKEAIEKYKAAVKASEDARAAHNEKVDTYNKAADAYNAKVKAGQDPGAKPQPPGEFKDPGPALAEKAEEILAEARKQRNTAADKARSAVQAARDAAPDKPSYGEQVQQGVIGVGLHASHFYSGVIKGTAGIVSFARSINPTDPYNLTHPAEYLTNLNSTVAGLVQVANDPWGAGKQMLDQFMKDPSEGLGRLAPDALLTAATGGAGAGVKGVRLAAEAADLAKNANRAENLSDGPGRNTVNKDGADQHGNEPKNKEDGGTDPVDLATGKMFLPQTDLSLPGALPLVFTRYVESGYTAGRWFGPSWASTVDQRLEVDAEGVVFVAEDGRLLAYPHPAPGVPTLPSAGSARMPLERTPDGGYTLTDPETGRVRHFSPPADGVNGIALIEQITDRNGHQIDFVYDETTGAPVRIEHSGGYTLRLTVADGRVTALHLGDQVVKRYGYTDGHLTEVADSCGRPLRFEYDDEARVVAWVDSNDRRYDYVYDNLHRCIAEGGTEGHMQVRITYDDIDPATGYKVTTLTTAAGHATRHLIDDHYRVVATIDPLGHTTRTLRDDHGRPLEVTDPLGRTTRFAYDEHGRLIGLTRPDGREITVTRNDLGLPTEIREVDGSVWRHTYDEHGNRTATTDPTGATTHYAYDNRGHLAAVTNPLGETTSVRCDAAGLPVEITDPLGAVTRYTRDAFGRPTAITDPLGAVTRLEWTVEGKLARRVNPDGAEERWEYDGEGNCVRHTDAAGGVTTYEYTHFDLLAAKTGPDGVRYTFEHDTELRLTKVTNPQGLTWSYEYDPAGRLISEIDFDDRTVAYTHDPVGQLTARTTPLGQTISYTYDELGHLVRKDADGTVTVYERDLVGRPVRIAGPDAELIYHRDRLGRVKTELVNGRALSFSYDALGRRTRRVTPTGAVSSFTYDAAGNRTTLTTCGRTLDFTHDAAGRETTRRVGEVSLSQLWDPAGRLTGQTLTGPDTTVVQQRTYHYRPDGYLTGIDDLLNGTRTFTLDAIGRVTTVTAANWTESYAYDAAGNQTQAAWPTTHAAAEATGERAYTGTRLTRAGSIRYEYDAAGRTVLRQKTRLSRKPDTWRYEWDAEDRLVSVTTPDGTVWRYRYDPLGRRIAKQRLTDTGEVAEQIDFTWDGPVLIEQTTTAPDLPHPVTLTWDHNGLTPVAQTERLLDPDDQAEIDRRFFAIVTDLVGTPTELVDETGEIAWHTRTTLWGTTTWNTGATAYTPLRFPGQYHDPETGLHYNLYRYYDPATARYATPDPLGLEPAPNPATYVHNPHTWTDPLGLAPEEGCGNKRGPYDFRAPNPAHPPNSAAVDAMRSAPRDNGVDCSEIADYILNQAGEGKVINFTTHSGRFLNTPQNGGADIAEFRYHEVYTDGKYVYDPELSQDPIPAGDYERALRLTNQGEKLIVKDGSYKGPLW
ncbi:putative T7SS-secreted protein [Streptomyces macrosporus]|uniref:Type IV secretion protein Rhs n=1 Tax=Streptomyces macrosporus TaxID=44032 RepID=A0ABN3K8W5_9ACTN